MAKVPSVDVQLLLQVSAGPTTASDARRALEGLRNYVSTNVFEDVRLLVTELVTNSVRHARLNVGDHVDVSIDCTGARTHVEVADPGPGFQPPIRTAESAMGSGWGLFLVSQIADRWGATNGAESFVWFEIDRYEEMIDLRRA